MSEPLWNSGPWQLISDLRQLVDDCVPKEREISESLAARQQAIEKRYHQACKRRAKKFEKRKAETQTKGVAKENEVRAKYETDLGVVRSKADASKQEIRDRAEADEKKEKEKLKDKLSDAGTKFDADEGNLKTLKNEINGQLYVYKEEFTTIQRQAERTLRRRWLSEPYPEPAAPSRQTFENPKQFCFACLEPARKRMTALSKQSLPRLLEGWHPLAVFLVMWGILVPACWWLDILGGWLWIVGASGVVAVVLVGLLMIMLRHTTRSESYQAYLALRQVLVDADCARQAAEAIVEQEYKRGVDIFTQQREQEEKKATEEYQASKAEIEQRRDKDLKIVGDKIAARSAEIAALRDRELTKAAQEHSRRMAGVATRYQANNGHLKQKFQQKLAEIEEQHRQQWDAMEERWATGIQQFQEGVEQLQHIARPKIFDWNAPEWKDWKPPSQIPSAISFGQVEVDLAKLEGAIPQDERLRPAQTDFAIPAVFPHRDRTLLLLKADDGEGLAQSITGIQTAMLRMLTSLPPSKVRFTIIDPVGLGENFAAFMHLADYNDNLVTHRIWTDTNHIEQRLADLTGHMENVLQAYLRNEFNTIDEYNQSAGDLAEPYRVLVVANFPAAFSDQAAARLASIVASGARCGVYTIMSVDTRSRMPREFHISDLERYAVRTAWSGSQFVWEESEFGPLPLTMDQPPEPDAFTDIVRRVGQAAKNADRVQVPFSCVAPADDQWWTESSSDGIDIPLGRAGAMKLQSLKLGRGTSQHVLIAGKTGSGKSTLMHALVTNAAIRYSPDEVQVYLIDFKKGVEFQAYAHRDLPHARVIAIESEREFGLSVLERLDLELKQRGDAYRAAGVHDMPGFRAARPDVPLPRILLIIDEFQELFTEDDRIAQNASLLLDRLVRQGRAFGVHVLLGSQTLAGSFSLPRSTIGQMAVRIALQCSESDAHLILSEDNTAARLLGRPGEAIYNDANGLLEGNHTFQVVWLEEEDRDKILERVQEFARSRNYPENKPLVFEGNMPGELVKNQMVTDLIVAPTWPSPSPIVRAWLGSAVAIKEPTSIEFMRQSGKNLLIVGHQEEEAMGLLLACLISLAAQYDSAGAKFYILDGARADSPAAGAWNRWTSLFPHAIRTGPVRALAEVMTEISEELARREQSHDELSPPVYLIIYDLARFRDLRRDEEMSFSRYDEDKPPSPAMQFARLLREGPPLGIHVLMWCDTYANVGRALDRSAMREIELRVLFQMNVSDSSNLIDSPAASQLGVHRALLYNEGDGKLEKFRPYGVPPKDWLKWVQERFANR